MSEASDSKINKEVEVAPGSKTELGNTIPLSDTNTPRDSDFATLEFTGRNAALEHVNEQNIRNESTTQIELVVPSQEKEERQGKCSTTHH
jgi:hypothetical protein